MWWGLLEPVEVTKMLEPFAKVSGILMKYNSQPSLPPLPSSLLFTSPSPLFLLPCSPQIVLWWQANVEQAPSGWLTTASLPIPMKEEWSSVSTMLGAPSVMTCLEERMLKWCVVVWVDTKVSVQGDKMEALGG